MGQTIVFCSLVGVFVASIGAVWIFNRADGDSDEPPEGLA